MVIGKKKITFQSNLDNFISKYIILLFSVIQ
jgi:hypothetical protein